ncbi:MAG: hypothetical protein IJ642_01450 [Oscillospiraceae bacterium]|nr:hypothetical protein [Oscillospiraceae bacterium]
MKELPKEIERKYLIEKPELAFLETVPECRATEITQTYLKEDGTGFGRRIRKRGSAGNWEYTYTRKKKIGFGERIELEDKITEAEYRELLTEADDEHKSIQKIRCCIPYENQILEIDLYAFSEEYATLEIELPDIEKPVILPDWLKIIADVTDKPGYSNFTLSLSLKFPEEK